MYENPVVAGAGLSVCSVKGLVRGEQQSPLVTNERMRQLAASVGRFGQPRLL